MASVNKVLLIGYLGKDPEVRYLPSGTAVCNFTVATTEKWKDGDEVKEKTEWSRCSAFGKTAELCGEYLHKGSLVYLEGKLDTRKYQKDGQDHYATQIRIDRVQFLSPKGDSAPARREPAVASAGKRDGGVSEMTDDCPF